VARLVDTTVADGDPCHGGFGAVSRSSALYFGRVTHVRAFPRRHRLSYRVWHLLVDLDELPELDRNLPGFAYDRAGLISFHTRDHGPHDGSPLRPWVERHLAHAGIDLEGGPIRILCFPRVAGYVFNPLSVWFCHHRDGGLRAIVYEVSNTFGERHSYVTPVEHGEKIGRSVRHEFDKRLFVSPFIDQEARYDFTTRIPDGRASVVVREFVAEGQVLTAVLSGVRTPLSGHSLARAFFGYPLLTVKVIVGIHGEAFKLWRKGAPYRPRPLPPTSSVTVLERTESPRTPEAVRT
jgi:uncharacterized protein